MAVVRQAARTITVRRFLMVEFYRERSGVSEQIDIAVDLAPPLPEIEFLREFVTDMPEPPPQVVEGILHQGCKLILGGTSKSNKSWCLLDLAISVASGEEWWGRRCARVPVVYINFELHRWSIAQRLNGLCAARPESKGLGDSLALWNLRKRVNP
jgi:RecA-family ATPase